MARCSRSLETIIQAHWVDCFDYRVKEIGIEKPFLSDTETKMFTLREACTILKWSEKDLRNRLYVLPYVGLSHFVIDTPSVSTFHQRNYQILQ
jgi:hypothetical protein